MCFLYYFLNRKYWKRSFKKNLLLISGRFRSPTEVKTKLVSNLSFRPIEWPYVLTPKQPNWEYIFSFFTINSHWNYTTIALSCILITKKLKMHSITWTSDWSTVSPWIELKKNIYGNRKEVSILRKLVNEGLPIIIVVTLSPSFGRSWTLSAAFCTCRLIVLRVFSVFILSERSFRLWSTSLCMMASLCCRKVSGTPDWRIKSLMKLSRWNPMFNSQDYNFYTRHVRVVLRFIICVVHVQL